MLQPALAIGPEARLLLALGVNPSSRRGLQHHAGSFDARPLQIVVVFFPNLGGIFFVVFKCATTCPKVML